MKRAADGDDAAFEDLVDRCQAGLIQFFTVLSRNRADGEDLAQEAFIRLYRARRAYRAQARFRTYLYRIAQNLWTDYLRRKKTRIGESPLDDRNRQGPPEPGSASANREPTVSVKTRKELYNAVLALSEEQRMVLLLNLVEDLTYPQIAETLSIPVGTAKSRMHHALRKLQALLKSR